MTATFGVVFFLSSSGYPVVENPAVVLGIQVVMLQGVSFGGVALFYLKSRGVGVDFLNVRFPTLRDVAWMVVGIVALIMVIFAIGVVLSQLGVESAENQIQDIGEENPEVFLVMIPLSFLLIGPGEELLFRGVIQGSLRETFAPASAVVVASVIFALGHVLALSGGPGGILVYVTVVFLLSLILGTVYEKSANLVVPATVHGAYNAMLFSLLYFMTKNPELVENSELVFGL